MVKTDKTDYYVYVHKRKDTGEVFYVGKGRLYRAKRKRKYKEWKRVYEEAGGFSYEILHSDLDEDTAYKLEETYILNPLEDWKLVNQRVSRKIELDFNEINSKFYYDETSPTFLRYKSYSHSQNPEWRRYPGDVAGWVCRGSEVYYKIKVNKKCIGVHRVIWLLTNGSIASNMVVDHIDRDSLNNHKDNLRLVTPEQNSRNTSKQNNPNVGVRRMDVKGNSYAVANWGVGGIKPVVKLFSFREFGEEEAMRLAKEARTKAIEELNSQDAGYLIYN